MSTMIKNCIQCSAPLLEWQMQAFQGNKAAWICVCDLCGMGHCLAEGEDLDGHDEAIKECGELLDKARDEKVQKQ